MSFPHHRGDLPYLTTAQMVEVDRLMIEVYRIELMQMMENAGRSLAHLARARFLGGDPRSRRVTVLAGTGGNGGGALVCARRLHNYGAQVRVLVTAPDDSFSPVPAHQLAILRRMQVSIVDVSVDASVNASTDVSADAHAGSGAPALVIDGVIGYSLKGAPRGAAADLIRHANDSGAPVLALDVPSGVDPTTGDVYQPAVRAAATLTLALPKQGLRAEAVRAHVGELYLADISVPPALYARLGLDVGPLFAAGDILRLW